MDKDSLWDSIGCIGYIIVGCIILVGLFYLIVGGPFVAINTFVALDKLFYLGFDAPVIAVWAFWGFVIGAAIQGCREMKIYGRKGIGILIAITPVLLLVLVGAIKIKRDSLLDTKVNTDLAFSSPSEPEKMVLIPAGEFAMVDNAGNSYENLHTVYVDAFYIDRYEVTNAEYAAFLNASGKHKDTQHIGFDPKFPAGRIERVSEVYRVQAGYENHPVSGVSWYGAMAYAKWTQKRLPTAAEWEKAARGGFVGKRFPWGDTVGVTRSNNAREVGSTTPVGSYAPNGYGLYDMAGNVREWCLDGPDSSLYAKSPLDNHLFFDDKISSVVNDFTSVTASRWVYGGDWHSNLYSALASRHGSNLPERISYSYHDGLLSRSVEIGIGFRCVTTDPPADKH